MRWIIGVLIALALVAGVIAFWPRADSDASRVTGAVGSMTTTTTSTTPTSTPTTRPPQTTTSSDEGSHVVETVEEAEDILRELWFGWFEGIYNQDEDRIREVVATDGFLAAGLDAFGTLEFISPPTRTGMKFRKLEILIADEQCLAVWSTTAPAYLDIETSRSGVEVLRRTETGWRFMSAWKLKGDLWQGDCEAELQPLS